MDHLVGNEAGQLDSAALAIVGSSSWAVEIRNQIRDISRSSLGVLISGPNGTGKERIARAVHALSVRARKPFIPVDCASAVGELFASHLFGHVHGAFTGARNSLGCFRVADGGTLFLDEVGELTPPMQAQLLRVLQEKALVPVGAVTPIPIDTRVIAATNRDLQDEILAGRFRRDLYHRLNMIELKTVPLKDRPEDIKCLACHFAADFCQENGLPEMLIGGAAQRLLRDYDWPGNVRELKNVVERVMLVNEAPVLTPESLPLLRSLTSCRQGSQSAAGPPPNNDTSVGGGNRNTVVDNATSAGEGGLKPRETWLRLDDLERNHVHKTLEHTLGNQTAAADLLGITRRVLSRLMKKHGLDNSRSRRGRPMKDCDAGR